MADVFIGIGGTGARVLESLVHLSAIGLGPSDLHVLLVDPDTGNGNLTRAKTVLTKYMKCRNGLGFGTGGGIFGTSYKWSSAGTRDYLAWAPIDLATVRKLRDYFNYDNLKKDPNPMLKRLGDMCDLLYAEKELNISWDQGFRGRPSVGAPVMAGIKDQLGKQPWSDVVQNLQGACNNGQPARVFVVGSIFGATGAAGFPAVARVLRNHAAEKKWQNQNMLMIGGAPVLPYFGYRVPPEVETQAERVFARPENFAVNTAAALRYYANAWKAKTDYDAVYLLGDQLLDASDREFAPGGEKQSNAPHYVEMYAALAACQFLTEWIMGDSKTLRQFMIGRKHADSIGRKDLPGTGCYDKLLGFTTFAYSFLGFYDQLLNAELEPRRGLYSWYLDRFPYKRELNGDEVQSDRTLLREYLTTFLEWLRDVERTTTRTVRLINKAALYLDPVKDPKFDSLLDDGQFRMLRFRKTDDQDDIYTPKYPFGYDTVWNMLCKASSRRGSEHQVVQRATSMGRFAYLLHQACSDFTVANYALKRD